MNDLPGFIINTLRLRVGNLRVILPAAVCVAGRASAGPWLFYMAPMQLVAPRAVTIAVAILAIICTMNFNVSFFVIAFNV